MINTTIITIIICSIILLAIIVGTILYFRLFVSKKYQKYLDNMNDFLKEPYVETLTTLRTIDITLISKEKNTIEDLKKTQTINIHENDELIKIRDAKELFAVKQLDIEDGIRKIRKATGNLSLFLKDRKYSEIKKSIKEIEKTKKEIENISAFVTSEAKNHIDQQKEFEKNVYEANKIARKVKGFLKDWKSHYQNNEELIISIRKKEKNINNIGNELGEFVKNRKYSEGFKVLKLYRRELWNVCVFGNRIDGFIKAIEIDSSKNIVKMKEACKSIREKLNSDLNYLEIEKYFDNANQEIIDARKYMAEMDVVKTMTAINNFYEILLNLNTVVNSEISAFNFVNNKKMEELEYYEKDTSLKFIQINEEYAQAHAIDKNYVESLLKENLDKMEQILSSINSLKNKYEIDLYVKEISNTTKQFKYKNIMYLIKQFNEIYYETKKLITNFYYEGISQRLRYDRLKKIFLKGNASINENEIILSLNNKELIQNIENQKSFIDQEILKNKISDDAFKKHVSDFYELISNFVNTIMKKTLIAKIFILINENYSYLRINNEELNEKIIEAEDEFMEGKYYNGLLSIISSIKKGVN